MKHKTTLN